MGGGGRGLCPGGGGGGWLGGQGGIKVFVKIQMRGWGRGGGGEGWCGGGGVRVDVNEELKFL